MLVCGDGGLGGKPWPCKPGSAGLGLAACLQLSGGLALKVRALSAGGFAGTLHHPAKASMHKDKEGAASAGSCSCPLSRPLGVAPGHRWVVAEQGMTMQLLISSRGGKHLLT